jgi:hypothetical protein
MERDGFILDREPGYFIEQSAEELLALGYSEEQLSGIRECLARRGLHLKGEVELKAEALPLPVEDEPSASKPERKR